MLENKTLRKRTALALAVVGVIALAAWLAFGRSAQDGAAPSGAAT